MNETQINNNFINAIKIPTYFVKSLLLQSFHMQVFKYMKKLSGQNK